MRVSAHEGETKVIRDTIGFVNKAACLHAACCGNGAEPVNIVFNHKKAAGHDECGEEVVVVREGLGAVDVGIEARREPGIFLDDFTGCLDVCAGCLLRVGDTPALCML